MVNQGIVKGKVVSDKINNGFAISNLFKMKIREFDVISAKRHAY
jgi:hypothetical protein